MKTFKEQMKANIWKYYLYRILCGIIFSAPIYMLFLRENGLSVTQIMIINAMYTIMMIFFDIPSGILADRWGRKNTLILSTVLFMSGFIIFTLSSNFIGFLLGEIIWGLSTANFVGTGEAFLYDSLKMVKKQDQYKKVLGNAFAISAFMYGFMGIFAGFISAAFSYRFAYSLSIIAPFLAIFISLWFKEPRHSVTVMKEGYLRHFAQSWNYVKNHKRIRFIILLGAVLMPASFLSWFLLQVRFIEIGLPVAYIGVAFAFLFIASALGHKACHHVTGFFTERRNLLLSTVGFLFAFLVIASTRNIILTIIIASLLWFISGFIEVFMPDVINTHTKSNHRATVLSISNNVSNIAFAIASPLIGVIVDAYSITDAFLVIALILAFYVIYMIFFYWMGLDKERIASENGDETMQLENKNR